MAAMTAVDSTDSVFMLMAYTVPQRTAAAEAGLLVEKGGDSAADPAAGRAATGRRWWDLRGWVLFERRPTAEEEQVELRDAAERARMLPQASEDKLLNISVVLTVISIVVALLISIVRPLSLSRPKQGGRERALTLLSPFPFVVLLLAHRPSSWGASLRPLSAPAAQLTLCTRSLAVEKCASCAEAAENDPGLCASTLS